MPGTGKCTFMIDGMPRTEKCTFISDVIKQNQSEVGHIQFSVSGMPGTGKCTFMIDGMSGTGSVRL